MKPYFLPGIFLWLLFCACGNTRTTQTTKPVVNNTTSGPTTVTPVDIPKPVLENDLKKLDGTWILEYISGPKTSLSGLYPVKKPELRFDVVNGKLSGNGSCNIFNGRLNADGNKISFTSPMGITKMTCPAQQGESVFLETLRKVDTYSVTSSNELNLNNGSQALLRFSKKQ